MHEMPSAPTVSIDLSNQTARTVIRGVCFLCLLQERVNWGENEVRIVLIYPHRNHNGAADIETHLAHFKNFQLAIRQG